MPPTLVCLGARKGARDNPTRKGQAGVCSQSLMRPAIGETHITNTEKLNTMNTENKERGLYSRASFKTLRRAVEIANKVGAFLLLYGKAGLGKTAAAKIIHETLTGRLDDGKISHNEWRNGESGYAVVNCIGQSPDSLTGFLVPDHETREGWFTKPEHWPIESVVGDAHITLCVDEVDKLSTDALSTLLGLADASDGGELYLGTHKLGKNVNVYFTANGREHGSTSSKVLPAPFVNRCYVREFEEDVDSWVAGYALPQGLGASPVVAWLSSYGKEWFCPAPEGRWDGRSIATPRSWAKAARAIDLDTPFDEAVNDVLWPLVGYDAANACAAYISLIHKVKPQLDALKNGGALPTDHRDQYAVLFAAIRTITKDYPDTGAAVKKGDLDWFIDALVAADNEIREWAVPLSADAGIPLKFSSKYESLTQKAA